MLFIFSKITLNTRCIICILRFKDRGKIRCEKKYIARFENKLKNEFRNKL